jgi:hypothetical protein
MRKKEKASLLQEAVVLLLKKAVELTETTRGINQ